MIGVIFQRMDEVVEIRIDGNNIYLRNTQTGLSFVPLDNMLLLKSDVVKEFPDLNDNENWRQIAIQRLKDKINSFDNEDSKVQYLISELSKKGYKAIAKQKEGYRPQRL